MKTIILASIVFFTALTACHRRADYEKIADGVIVHFKGNDKQPANLIKLRVISDRIIHVEVSPADSFPTVNSLMITRWDRQSTKWTLSEQDDQLLLRTPQLLAIVSLITGEVIFKDSLGNVVLAEKHGGGKTFSKTQVDETNSYEVRQVFESPNDEAFYGLGQHQEGVMNYKGKDVSLFQYNTKVSVPFLVSNKNYGILWDNNSLSKFGDPRPYRSLSQFKLYDHEGNPGGLSARYFSKSDSSQVFVNKLDSAINYESLSSLKNFPSNFPIGNGLVRWDGFIESNYSCIHKFLITYAGYTKIWIDGKLVADHWRQAWNPGTLYFHMPLTAGRKYPIKVEWNPDGNESYLSLKWLEAIEGEQNMLSLYSEAADIIDYYFIYGKNLDEVISGYRHVTGKAPLFPRWAMGLWQSRERYKSQAEILSVASEFRKRKIPLDNIVLDWSYWKQDQWGSQQFDPERFPDPSGMIKTLHEKDHAHFMISVWPKFYEGIDNYKTFDSKGWLFKTNIKNRQRDWIGQGYVSTFYDAFNPQARSAFWKLLRDNIYSKGVDAWWLDATEPDILSNASLEQRKLLMNPTALGPSAKYFNAYPLVNEMGVYEGQRSANPNNRVFILTRSAFAGSQRYAAATWSGDIAARWQDLRAQIPAGLNFSLSGIPYWTTDIGGFSVEKRFQNAKGDDLEEWREQMTRWFQFGAFCPLFRVHGQFPYREIFNVAPNDHVAYQTMLYYDKLRYALMPYIYSLTGKTYLDDYTIMRALVMDFPADKNVSDIGDEYMFGPDLLVAPVTDYKATSRKVYFPATTNWFDLYTGKLYKGGETLIIDAPLTKIPVFVKQGSILPVGPEMQYTAEKKADPIRLYVYTGKDGSFDLYEDEDVNYNYEKGVYSIIPFLYNEQQHTLTIGERKGSFPGMLKERTFEIVWVNNEKPEGMSSDAHPQRVVHYSGQPVAIEMSAENNQPAERRNSK